MSMALWIILGIIVCLILSAFFSRSEITYSSCSTIRLENLMESGDKRAKAAFYITEHFENALSAILIGNNLVNIAGSSLTTVLVVVLFGQENGDKYAWVATLLLTSVVIIFSETIPKITGKKNANRYALSLAYPIRGIMIILYPLIWLNVGLIHLISLPFKEKKVEETEEEAVEELQNIIETAEDEKVLDEDRTELIQSAIDFSDISASEVMTPRIDVLAIDVDDDWAEIIKKIEKSPYSRLPVYKDSMDNVIGVLYLNKFFKVLADSENGKTDIRPLLNKPLYVYKTMKLPDVLAKLRKGKQHLAVVTDEYGGTLGIISMEDVLEEIVGDIWDDTDIIEEEVVERSEGEFVVDGDMPISDFLELVDIQESDFDFESETVGGWVIELNGEFPKTGDILIYNNITAKVIKMNKRRVEEVLIDVYKS